MTRSVSGFTLVELMITVGVVGVLAAVAIPSYQNYTRRAYYGEVVQATARYKVGVTECYQKLNTLVGCNAGSYNIPAAIASTTGPVASITVANGVITATPTAQNGIAVTDDYVLTPTVVDKVLTWTTSGGGVANGYAQ